MLVVLGAAESGVGAAILAQQKGFEVFVSDKGAIKDTYRTDLETYKIRYESGRHSVEYILEAATLVIKSPGIPEKSDIIQALRAKKIPIISEIEFAARYTNARIIAISGSNGKTTTTALCYHILKNNDLKVRMAGNIGDSFARMVALNQENDCDFYVLEVSSFQLDDIENFKPYISVLTNITPDHLDRYEYSFDKYRQAKFNLTRQQNEQDYFVFFESESINEYLKKHPQKAKYCPYTLNNSFAKISLNSADTPPPFGACYNPAAAQMLLYVAGKDCISLDPQNFSLKGKHNLQNCMAAAIVGSIVGLSDDKILDKLTNFKGISHRLENVANFEDITFINDSKATNIDSAWYALDAMNRPTVWIVGGLDKGNDYSILLPLVRAKVKAIVCLGLDNQKIHTAFGALSVPIFDTQSAKDAVQTAYKVAQKGDVVLLSPACASFDLFKNYEDRGNQFREEVLKLDNNN